jgi:hypothetical protein
VEHRAQILAVFALVAIAAGGLLYLVGEGAAGQAVWGVAVGVLAAELAVEVARGARPLPIGCQRPSATPPADPRELGPSMMRSRSPGLA